MRPESVRTVRIRSQETRNETGSVSPPATSVPGSGKMIFVEKMRKMFANLDPAQLEFKIEQLWKGLTPSQKEKFIGKGGEKENLTVISNTKNIPVLERRNNCKAIAKVLDLKSKRPAVSYAELVKNRMKSWRKEGSIISSRQLPPSPISSPCPPLESPLKLIKAEPSDEMPVIEAEVMPDMKRTIKMEIIKKEDSPPPPKKVTPVRKPVMKPVAKTIVKKYIVKRTPIIPKISYEKACQEYYSTLSQSFLFGPYPDEPKLLSAYANVMEGCQMIREYNFGVNL